MTITFLVEHFKIDQGALVVSGAVIGKHWSRVIYIHNFSSKYSFKIQIFELQQFEKVLSCKIQLLIAKILVPLNLLYPLPHPVDGGVDGIHSPTHLNHAVFKTCSTLLSNF